MRLLYEAKQQQWRWLIGRTFDRVSIREEIPLGIEGTVAEDWKNKSIILIAHYVIGSIYKYMSVNLQIMITALLTLMSNTHSLTLLLIRPMCQRESERTDKAERERERHTTVFKANLVNSTHSGPGECNSTSLILHWYHIIQCALFQYHIYLTCWGTGCPCC